MGEETRFVLYSPRQNAFHVETIDEISVNALKTVKAYLKAEDKVNYAGADYMLIRVCSEDQVEEVIDAFKEVLGLE